MTERKSISSELEQRLAGLKKGGTMDVIVFANNSPDFDKLCFYLGSLANPQLDPNPLKYLTVNLTKKQIYDLAEQPYVKIILENQKIRLTD